MASAVSVVHRVLRVLLPIVVVAVLAMCGWIGWQAVSPLRPTACENGWQFVGALAPGFTRPEDDLASWLFTQPGAPPPSEWRVARLPAASVAVTGLGWSSSGRKALAAAFVNTTYDHGHRGYGRHGVILGHIEVANAGGFPDSRHAEAVAVVGIC